MPWKTRKQRKLAKAKVKVKKIIIMLLIVVAIVGAWALHSDESNKPLDAPVNTSGAVHTLQSCESTINNLDNDFISVSIGGRGFIIKW